MANKEGIHFLALNALSTFKYERTNIMLAYRHLQSL